MAPNQSRLPLTRATKHRMAEARASKKKNDPQANMSPASKKFHKNFVAYIIDEAFSELMMIRKKNGWKSCHNDMSNVIKKFQARGHGFVNRWHLEYRLKNFKVGKKVKASKSLFPSTPAPVPCAPVPCAPVESVAVAEDDDTVSLLTDETHDSSQTKSVSKGGRKKGSTKKAQREQIIKVKSALTAAATQCIQAKHLAVIAKKKVEDGTFKRIIEDVRLEYDLPLDTVKYETIKSRVLANNPTGSQYQCISPLYLLEPIISNFCCQLARIGEALTKYEVFELADDLIRSTEHAEAYINFCGRRHITKDWNQQIVGESWYRNFMKRYETRLKQSKCKVIDNNRRTYCTYDNFSNMYSAVYDSMVEAGVAIKLEEEVMLDSDGNITHNKQMQHGQPTRYLLTKPERCVYVDETGCNTNCKNDGQVGGQRVVMGVSQKEGGKSSATTDLHFTVLAFTSGTGEAIMCAVILKSEKDIVDMPVSWKIGVDATKEITFGETNLDTYNLNVEGGVSIGGPKCNYDGKEVPCFVCSSPNASITSELLAKMLQQIDHYDIFKRSESDGMPFLLVDGHHSRTRLPFLEYITNPLHPWKVCIGVPYGTHLWQPHDSTELNGTFKMKLYKEKLLFLKNKPRGACTTFTPTDIIPKLNKTWNDTLGNKYKAKKSIADRGWGPLTYTLLNHPIFTEVTEDLVIFNPFAVGFKVVPLLDTTTLNVNSVGTRVDKAFGALVEDQLKSDARKRRIGRMLEEGEQQTNCLEAFQKMTSFSSGKCCVNNVFCISDTNIRDRLVEVEADKKRKLDEKEVQLQQTQNKSDKKFNAAAKKYFEGKNLLADDLCSLLKEVSTNGDSPIKKKVDEIRIQFNNRKDRMHKYDLNSNDDADSVPLAINDDNNVDIDVSSSILPTDSIGVSAAPPNINHHDANIVDSAECNNSTNSSFSLLTMLARTCDDVHGTGAKSNGVCDAATTSSFTML